MYYICYVMLFVCLEVKIHPETLRNDNAKLKVGEVPGNIRDNS